MSCTKCNFMKRTNLAAVCAEHGGELEDHSMTATMDEIKNWTREGLEGVRYCIVMHDTFDHDNYPVYAKDEAEFWELWDKYQGRNMQKVEEVYDLVGGDRTHWYEQRSRIMEMPKRPTPTDVEAVAEG